MILAQRHRSRKGSSIRATRPDSGRFAALQQKLADAVVTSPPLDFEGKKSGYNVLARAYEYVNYPLSGVGVNQVDSTKPRPSKANGQSLDQGKPFHP